MRFVDTNILLYFVGCDEAESAQQAIAAGLLEATDLALSVQVLQEFYVQATRPTRENPLRHRDALALIESWKRYPIQETTLALVEQALAARTTTACGSSTRSPPHDQPAWSPRLPGNPMQPGSQLPG